MRTLLSIFTVTLFLTVAGCKQEKAATAPEPAPKAEQSQSNESAPAKPEPAASPEPAKKATAPDTETITNNACLEAAKKQTNEPNITVTSNEFSEANALVMLAVGSQKAPWRCLVANNGQVAELSFQGDDSAGVPTPPASESSGSDVSDAAINACLSAVARQTNESDMAVTSTEFSQANSLVMIGVGAQRAPWKCLVSNDGQGAEVSFEGDDSAGVPQQRSSSDVSDTQLQACLEAVKGQTNESNLSVLSSEFSEANSLVMVGVGEQQAPWHCLISNDGVVQEVMSQVDEGKN